MAHTNDSWSENELQKIAKVDDLHIAPFRDDGVTYGTLTWIWSVVVDDDLYVRPYNGKSSRWYQAALRQKAGKIRAAGLSKNVSFAAADESLDERIDAAYRAKYARSSYLASMIGPRVRSTTVKISPRDVGAK